MSAPALEVHRSAVLGEELHSVRLASGLTMLVIPKPGYRRSLGVFATRYGSTDRRFRLPGGEEYEAPDGVAHFLEHKLFEGRDKPVFDRFSELGASCNAATAFKSTHYYFTTTESFDDCLDVLIDFVQHPAIDEERVEKEKGIIAQEVRMYEDLPDWRVFFNLLKGLYHVHPVRIPIGGTVESVQAICLDDLMTCYRGFYRPENMVLAVAGDHDPDRIRARVEAAIEVPPGEVPERLPIPEPDHVCARRVEECMNLARCKVLVGYRDVGPQVHGRAQLRRELLSSLALEIIFGQSSPIYMDLFSRGVIDDSFMASYRSEDDYGFTAFGGESDEPEGLIEELEASLERALAGGFAQSELERVRNNYLGGHVRRWNSPESAGMAHLHDALSGLSPFAMIDVLAEITPEQVLERLATHLVPERRAVSILRPLEGS